MLFLHVFAPRQKTDIVREIIPGLSKSSVKFSYFLPGRSCGGNLAGTLQDLLSGGALDHYILNEDISKWHFSAHGAVE